MKEKKLHVLTLTGGPRERGLSHGEEMREEIARHLELWQEDLRKDTGMSPDDYLDKFYAETDFLPAIEQFAPDLLEEVRGIAEASGQDFRVVLIRQMSDEEPWFRQILKFGRPIMKGHCSSLGAWDQGERPNLIAQNMDIPGYCDGLQLILKIKEADSDLESLVFTVAGKISLAGMTTELRFTALSREVEKQQPIDVKRAAEILSQHEGPVCIHHGDDLYTLGCLIMELDPDNPRFHIAPGPPCETRFSIFNFDR